MKKPPPITDTVDIGYDPDIDEVQMIFNESDGRQILYRMTLDRFRKFVEGGAAPIEHVSRDNHQEVLASMRKALLRMEEMKLEKIQ